MLVHSLVTVQSLYKWSDETLNVHSFPHILDVINQPRHVWCPDFASLNLALEFNANVASKY